MNCYNIKRFLRTSFLGQSRIYLLLRYLIKKDGVEKAILKHLGNDVSVERKKLIKTSMRHAMVKYRWDFDEFFLFDYEGCSEQMRKEYVPEFDKNIFCDLVNDKKESDLFLDKWGIYLKFKEFYGRDIYNIRGHVDIDRPEFYSFLKLHPRFMLKPVFSALGNGIEILEASNLDNVRSHIHELIVKGVNAILLEELINQDEIMASLHPESVNTLRMRTINVNGEIRLLYPSLRIGKGSAFVDNAGAGGILCNIDVETGQVYSASDKLGNSFITHPDTGIQLIGFQIPRWNEAVEIVKKMALVLPKVRYVGWDIALSKNGWVMIEGNNKGQWGFQYSERRGFRHEMNSILRELKLKEIN